MVSSNMLRSFPTTDSRPSKRIRKPASSQRKAIGKGMCPSISRCSFSRNAFIAMARPWEIASILRRPRLIDEFSNSSTDFPSDCSRWNGE